MSALFQRVLFFIVFSGAVAFGAQEPIALGVYKLKGSNPIQSSRQYSGKIVIQKEGANYRVTWMIGDNFNQSQLGIGILTDAVLSVGYLDTSGRDFGVVSMKVINSKLLKGKWSSIFSDGSFGEEEFEFEGATVPKTWKLEAPKKKKFDNI